MSEEKTRFYDIKIEYKDGKIVEMKASTWPKLMPFGMTRVENKERSFCFNNTDVHAVECKPSVS